MTDLERQLALAKMLPEKIECFNDDNTARGGHITPYFYWRGTTGDGHHIKETEWLHICHLIEQGLDAKEHEDFRQVLAMKTEQSDGIERPRLYSEASERDFCSATWQQRADALIAVKKGHHAPNRMPEET